MCSNNLAMIKEVRRSIPAARTSLTDHEGGLEKIGFDPFLSQTANPGFSLAVLEACGACSGK